MHCSSVHVCQYFLKAALSLGLGGKKGLLPEMRWSCGLHWSMKANPCNPGNFCRSPFSHCVIYFLPHLFTLTFMPLSSVFYAFSRVNTFLPANLSPVFSLNCLITPPIFFCSFITSLYLCPALSFLTLFPSPSLLYTASPSHLSPPPCLPAM